MQVLLLLVVAALLLNATQAAAEEAPPTDFLCSRLVPGERPMDKARELTGNAAHARFLVAWTPGEHRPNRWNDLVGKFICLPKGLRPPAGIATRDGTTSDPHRPKITDQPLVKIEKPATPISPEAKQWSEALAASRTQTSAEAPRELPRTEPVIAEPAAGKPQPRTASQSRASSPIGASRSSLTLAAALTVFAIAAPLLLVIARRRTRSVRYGILLLRRAIKRDLVGRNVISIYRRITAQGRKQGSDVYPMADAAPAEDNDIPPLPLRGAPHGQTAENEATQEGDRPRRVPQSNCPTPSQPATPPARLAFTGVNHFLDALLRGADNAKQAAQIDPRGAPWFTLDRRGFDLAMPRLRLAKQKNLLSTEWWAALKWLLIRELTLHADFTARGSSGKIYTVGPNLTLEEAQDILCTEGKIRDVELRRNLLYLFGDIREFRVDGGETARAKPTEV